MPPTLARARTIAHDDRLSLVEHLDELRTRIVICIGTVVVVSSVCFWQNHTLLKIINAPLPNDVQPVTLAPAEAFTTTLTVCGYSALIISLPVLIYQLYAYVLPAFSDKERKQVVPLLLLAPALFIAGVLFAYFVVLGPAIHFLLNFNSGEFNNQVRAKDYYGFVTTMLAVMGLIFEVPMVILALCRVGIVTPTQLRANRRYAYLVIAVVAALLPTIDPVSLILEMIPIFILYELSILLASAFTPEKSEDEPDPTELST